MTGKIFLNYRLTDADAWADRIYERLIQHFPRDNIFMDIDGNIPFGFPWADWLDQQVAECDLMLVLIGRLWVAEFEARAAPDERDFVRVEIESALARRIPVVPVFLGDAQQPAKASLPPTVQPLLDLQATRLQRGNFETDVKVLVEGAVWSIQLARGEVPASTTAAEPSQEDQYQAKGRINIDAPIVESLTGNWFLPGDRNRAYFKDHEQGPEMVVVPAGEFVMGSPDNEPQRYSDEGPQHTVKISAPFAVARHAITFDQWDAAVSDGACNRYRPDDEDWAVAPAP